MKDITGAGPNGLRVSDTNTSRAKNILSTQLGSLEYAQDLGIDREYFLREDIAFQNEAFKAYMIQRLAAFGITVESVIDQVEALYEQYVFNLAKTESEGGMIAR